MPGTRSLRSLIIPATLRGAFSGPPSPTFSDATNVSTVQGIGPEQIITRAHLKNSVNNFEKLIASCAAYRSALMALSNATAAFADAMGNCASLKGPSYETGTRLQAASGLHHLMGNHWHVLAETCNREFEQPLREHLTEYRSVVTSRSQTYESALREKSTLIRQTEARNLSRKSRNLQSFRENLATLQRHVDELDELKAAHYAEIAEHEEGVWNTVQGKVAVVVRSTMDVFDRLTAKASDPIIEPMLQSVPDPFDAYGPAPAHDQIFSILPPLAIGAPSPAPSSAASDADPSDLSHPTSLSGSLPGTGVPGSAGVSPWGHIGTGGYFGSDPGAAWADAISPVERSPPGTAASISPTGSSGVAGSPPVMPTPAVTSFVGSLSPGHRRKGTTDGSKLKNQLNAIKERSSSGSSADVEVVAAATGNGNGWLHDRDGYSHLGREGSEATVRHAERDEDGGPRTRSPLSDDTETGTRVAAPS